MMRHVWLALTVLVVGALGSVPTDLDHQLMRGKQAIYRGYVDVAETIFARVIRSYPEYPHGYFNQAFLKLLYFSQDMTNDTLLNDLRRATELTLAVARRYQETHPGNPDASFHLGVSYGIYAIIAVLERDYLDAYRFARRAKGFLEKTVQLDSSYNDAYLGLGLFHYYVALLPGVVRFFADLLGFEGDRRKGIQEVVRTMEYGHFLAEEARFMYYFIRYFLEGYEELGANGFRLLSVEYPDNPVPHLVLGYHYRRTGYLEEAWATFQQAPERLRHRLPQLIVIKYYNLAVLAFEMNRYEQAEHLFNQLAALPLRKTRYYQAAIDFYRGLLADLKMNHATARQFYARIPDNKKTRFWFHNKRMLEKYPPDNFLADYFWALHLFNWRKFRQAHDYLQPVLQRLENGAAPNNPNLPFLLRDLLAYSKVALGQIDQGLSIYNTLIPQLKHMPDKYHRAWIQIHFARCLRIAGQYGKALKVLKAVNPGNDTYTKVILEREKFVVKSTQNQEVPMYEEE